jgi:hypothetical protein
MIFRSPWDVKDKAGAGANGSATLLGLPFLLERQYFVCSPGMHSHRAGFPRSREHAEGFLAEEVPAGGSGDRGH